ncbi:MAG: ADP-forming succinate--CoA ligase subunit beta [Candidatus Cloacimonetes bacterium]|nr:ADP-forming succinate--CoA ligase subunit beta [Candidatus Cloacimonadota bacterium]
MNIHEYQAKKLLHSYGVTVTEGIAAFSTQEAVTAAKALGGENWVIKAQVHAGGRGKAGGVKFAANLEEVKNISQKMLGMTLVTHQTGAQGKLVRRLYVQIPIDIEKEYYLGIVLDRKSEMPVIMASTEGGMEIEQVAETAPEKIIKVGIDPVIGLRSFHLQKLSFGLGLTKIQSKSFQEIVARLFNAYLQSDASLIEINPLVLQSDDTFIALDAKINFDDNALFRHPDILEMRDIDEEDPGELEAANYGLSYIKLSGDVGCMVNGAGLAMSTMDIIKQTGGEPANFLDVGGAASADTVARGFEIILRDPNVKVIFVNIFGGIVRCDRIANGILEAAERIHVKVPVIVRLDGTNAAAAAEILRNANISSIHSAHDLEKGARLAVAAAKGEK